ncbi:hypothetical protein P4U97_01150 [Bacillus swezeyi]|uniref:hypothetical protein n=1 Tax=Bacillus swezeyi TaxID=1925020 RepID=UPI002E1DD850|nr:hypothetical protein [Bacillus swezeyi]
MLRKTGLLLFGLGILTAFFLLHKIFLQLIGIGLLLMVLIAVVYFTFRILAGILCLVLMIGGIFLTIGLFVSFFNSFNGIMALW